MPKTRLGRSMYSSSTGAVTRLALNGGELRSHTSRSAPKGGPPINGSLKARPYSCPLPNLGSGLGFVGNENGYPTLPPPPDPAPGTPYRTRSPHSPPSHL